MDILLTDYFIKLFAGLFALLMLMLCLRAFDFLTGRFTNYFNKIEKDSNALAIYFGFRLLAVAILLGVILA